jgi:DNA primase
MDIISLLEDYGLELETHGSLYKILCPFHTEASASCIIYPDTNSFYCWGCHEGGDLIKFISLYEGISKAQVKERLSSISDLKHRLNALDVRKELDYTKETLQLVAKLVYKTIRHHPKGWAAVAPILESFDDELLQERFTFSQGVKIIEALKQKLGVII